MENPIGVAADAAGRRFVADLLSHVVRRIEPDGTLVTLAGLAYQPGAQDGVGAEARFHEPRGLAADGAGGVFVADSRNHAIRHVDANGVVTTVAGSLGKSGKPAAFGTVQEGADALFNGPTGLAWDGQFLYIADSGNHAIRRMTGSNRRVELFAGPSDGESGGSVFSVSRSQARFNNPVALAVAADGLLWIADRFNSMIRRSPTASPAESFVDALTGLPGEANFVGAPSGVAIDPATGEALVFDSGGRLLRVSAAFFNVQVTTLAQGDGDEDGPLATAKFGGDFNGIAFDLQRQRFIVADRSNSLLREIDFKAAPAQVTTLTGQRAAAKGSQNGLGAQARFSDPVYLAPGADGSSVLVGQDKGSLPTLRRVGADGLVEDLSSPDPFPLEPFLVAEPSPTLLFEADSQRLRISTGQNSIFVGEVTAGPAVDGPSGIGRFDSIRSLVVDPLGQAWVADLAASAVRVVTPSGVIQRVAGRYGEAGFRLGDALDEALFASPIDLQFGADGSLFVLDAGNRALLRIAPGADGRQKVSLVAGGFDDPRGLAIDALGRLYVAEITLNTIVRIDPDGQRKTIAGRERQRGFQPGALPGALALPQTNGSILELNDRVGMRIIGNRLLLTMEQAVVQIAPLPA